MKAALYLRSSKDRSDVSIDAQRRQLVELAQARGLPIVAEFADAVESGKDDDRPDFQRLLRDIKNPRRGWEAILMLDTARIARRRHLAIIFEEVECKKAGIRVIYKSLPESDPITEMLLKSILQARERVGTWKGRGAGGFCLDLHAVILASSFNACRRAYSALR
ncbi:MAG: recombinase family protein [Candidatus Thermoplasmatota archaeon]|nr:recombinase family protein [Candidatus Thermoplasmatota archaeon]